MYLVAIAWMYVVLMVAVAEALSTQGSLLGAMVTVVLYGLLPLSVLLYIMATPARRRARVLREAQAQSPMTQTQTQMETAPTPAPAAPASEAPDGGSHAAGDAVAPERKET